MRSLLLPLGAAFVLSACGATNVNQENYDRIKEAYEAEHGGGHGGGHAKDDGHADADAHAKDDAHAGGDAHAKDDAHAEDGTADAAAADEAHADAGGDLEAGKKVYNTFCVSCHGPDGKGMNGLAANLAEDKTRLAKPTEELVKNIREGYSGEVGVMPPWGAVVSEDDAKNVIAFLRHEYPAE